MRFTLLFLNVPLCPSAFLSGVLGSPTLAKGLGADPFSSFGLRLLKYSSWRARSLWIMIGTNREFSSLKNPTFIYRNLLIFFIVPVSTSNIWHVHGGTQEARSIASERFVSFLSPLDKCWHRWNCIKLKPKPVNLTKSIMLINLYLEDKFVLQSWQNPQE